MNKRILLFFFAASLLVSCSEYKETVEPGPPALANCQGVFFPTTNKAAIELEPTAPTEIMLTIARLDTVNAVEVPITVTVNDGNVFVVPQKVSFAASKKTTQLKVTFPTAGEGITYKLSLKFEGDEFVNPYGSGVTYLNTSVTRIKWNKLNPFIYIDGTFIRVFAVPGVYPQYVETEKAEVGGATRYRFKNVYASLATDEDEYGILNGFPWNDPGDYDEDNNYYTIIIVNENGTVSMERHNIGVDWGYGYFIIGSALGNISSATAADNPLGSFSEGKIVFPANSLFINLPTVGSFICDKSSTVIYTTLEAYLADNMKIKDFNDVEYKKIPGAVSEFESKAYGNGWDQIFSKAIDIDEENDASEYKNLFYLPDLYAKNFGLAFYYDGKTVKIPANQRIGRKAFQQDVYVSQSDKVQSSVITTNNGLTTYTLGLKFHYKDGTVVGDFAEKFFYSKDGVEYSIDDFCGNFTLTGIAEDPDEDDDASFPVTIKKGIAKNSLIISGWSLNWEPRYTTNVEATFDPVTSTMSIASEQELNKYAGYSMMLVNFDEEDFTDEPMVFSRKLNGKLELTPTSEAIGYFMLLDHPTYSWVIYDGQYDIAFTPRSGAAVQSLATKSASSFSLPPAKSRTTVKGKIVRKEKSLEGYFSIQPKESFKKAPLKDAVPVF